MRGRLIASTFCCLLLGILAAVPVGAQNLPQECRDAMEVRSPQGQVDLFTTCLETGRLSGVDKATTLKQRAIAYMHLGQHQRAVNDLNEAMRLRSDDPDNYYLRGVAYRALGKLQQAVDDSTRAIGLDGNFAAAYANRAFAYKMMGNANQARNDARRASELDPSVRVPRF